MILNNITNEILLDKDNNKWLTIGSVAFLLNVRKTPLRESLCDEDSTLNTYLEDSNVNVETTDIVRDMVPLSAFGMIAKYYAYHAGEECTLSAEVVDKCFTEVGANTAIEQQLKYHKVILENRDMHLNRLDSMKKKKS